MACGIAGNAAAGYRRLKVERSKLESVGQGPSKLCGVGVRARWGRVKLAKEGAFVKAATSVTRFHAKRSSIGSLSSLRSCRNSVDGDSGVVEGGVGRLPVGTSVV